MVNIVRHAIDSPVVDDEAMHAFRTQWQAYQKLVDHNSLAHREARSILHREIVETIGRPFRFLDLACGDASMTVAALQQTPVVEYHGIDLSAPALALARHSVASLECEVRLEQNDFVAAMRNRPEPADVIWIGFSLHHLQTDDKLELMREVRQTVGDKGLFLIFEPTRLDGETREVFLKRFERTYQSAWKELTPAEWTIIWDHVRTCDFPEESSKWLALGHEAGFSQADNLFTDSGNILKIFRYRP